MYLNQKTKYACKPKAKWPNKKKKKNYNGKIEREARYLKGGERERNGRGREALGSPENLWLSSIYALRWSPTC